jgi:hypothetical protein
MACMVPDAQMNAQERACCRTMKNQCGQMEMPASHGCCQKTPLSVHDNALDTKTVAFHPAAVAVIRLAASELLPSTSIVAEWVDILAAAVPALYGLHPKNLVFSSVALRSSCVCARSRPNCYRDRRFPHEGGPCTGPPHWSWQPASLRSHRR